MDDEKMVRKVSEAMLESMGYEVLAVADGAEALQVYQQALGTENAFAAVILDITVPGGMGGKEVVKKMRALDSSLKAIVSSGYHRHAVMADYQKYGFDGVVAKPYRLKDMSRVIKAVLG
jgi:CheY-like chemotaxis protein